MKSKKLYITLLILLCSIYFSNLYAQCANTGGNPDWCKNANTVTSAHILGTGNAFPLRIVSGGVATTDEHMRIENSGFVGIGSISSFPLRRICNPAECR
jgi:hypothetical protein